MVHQDPAAEQGLAPCGAGAAPGGGTIAEVADDSQSEDSAEAGTLAAMVGGDAEALATVRCPASATRAQAG